MKPWSEKKPPELRRLYHHTNLGRVKQIIQMEYFPQPGSRVKVLKAMLQTGRIKSGSASSSCTLLRRVTVTRVEWLLIICADKQAACDLWSAPPRMFESPPNTFIYKRLFCKNVLQFFCWLTLTSVAVIFYLKRAFIWVWISIYFKQISLLLVFFF